MGYPEMSDELRDIITKNMDVTTDKEAVQLEFMPATRNLPLKYFPFTGGNYHSPMVAVKVTPDAKAKGQLLHIECRAYFDGVEHSTKEKSGLALFEVYIHKGE